MERADKKGYLNENYRFFHSTDNRDMDFEPHFHEFHKVVYCLRGHVLYTMEGKNFHMSAGDLLLVPRHCIHKSYFRAQDGYERILIFLQDSFLQSFSDEALSSLFARKGNALLRPGGEAERLLLRGEESRGLLRTTYLLQFLLALGTLPDSQEEAEGQVSAPDVVRKILDYITAHLADDLSLSALSARFFLSESRIMHLFKEYTGFSVHKYISQKRLIASADAIKRGMGVMEAARQSGWEDYTAFLKAFRSLYGCLPSEMR